MLCDSAKNLFSSSKKKKEKEKLFTCPTAEGEDLMWLYPIYLCPAPPTHNLWYFAVITSACQS